MTVRLGDTLALADPYDGLPAGTRFTITGAQWRVLHPGEGFDEVAVRVYGESVDRVWRQPGPMAIAGARTPVAPAQMCKRGCGHVDHTGICEECSCPGR